MRRSLRARPSRRLCSPRSNKGRAFRRSRSHPETRTRIQLVFSCPKDDWRAPKPDALSSISEQPQLSLIRDSLGRIPRRLDGAAVILLRDRELFCSAFEIGPRAPIKGVIRQTAFAGELLEGVARGRQAPQLGQSQGSIELDDGVGQQADQV